MINIHRLSALSLTTPRRVMLYILLWCESGEVTIKIDGTDFKLVPHSVITITSGQFHSIEDNNAHGYMLEFTYDFFCKDDKDVELIFHNGLFCHFDLNEVIHVPNHKLVQHYLETIETELTDKNYQYGIVVHAAIERILVEINRTKVQRGDEIWKPEALFLKFLELVRASFDSRHTLTYYGEQLNVPEQRLNNQAKLHAGKTAQMVIHGLIASEAKRLLIYEDMSIKEIATRLGFDDPFYFSNFFKKHTGHSPKAFREARPE